MWLTLQRWYFELWGWRAAHAEAQRFVEAMPPLDPKRLQKASQDE